MPYRPVYWRTTSFIYPSCFCEIESYTKRCTRPFADLQNSCWYFWKIVKSFCERFLAKFRKIWCIDVAMMLIFYWCSFRSELWCSMKNHFLKNMSSIRQFDGARLCCAFEYSPFRHKVNIWWAPRQCKKPGNGLKRLRSPPVPLKGFSKKAVRKKRTIKNNSDFSSISPVFRENARKIENIFSKN